MARTNKDKLPEKEEVKAEAMQKEINNEELALKQPAEIKTKETEDVEIVVPIDEAKIEKVKEEIDTWKPVTELGKKSKKRRDKRHKLHIRQKPQNKRIPDC